MSDFVKSVNYRGTSLRVGTQELRCQIEPDRSNPDQDVNCRLMSTGNTDNKRLFLEVQHRLPNINAAAPEIDNGEVHTFIQTGGELTEQATPNQYFELELNDSIDNAGEWSFSVKNKDEKEPKKEHKFRVMNA